ncbi:hypothetical protein [Pedobacter zeae]|uniref:Uncharacterized protein n=1 Tax=Pedobacter zeae TaxID=1737356 RepID=A0A7W6P5A7_9SPHI|nr:hypothetical protein [Pedobacter zeae]MBB4106704.1 hypothetical protein [Pedobacter zeae]GGH03246.1 hypothetical protein GCM10007422_18170 [Pedobacter zeae]
MEKDQNSITKAEIRSVLVSLNLSPFVIALFDETDSLNMYGFYNHFSPPYHILHATRKEQEVFLTDRYIPLFETIHDFSQVLAYDKVLQGFIRYSPENLSTLKTNQVLTWDGIFVKQILTWYEEEKNDPEILALCDLLGLKHAQKVLDSIYQDLGTDYSLPQIEEWEKMIITEIDARIK